MTRNKEHDREQIGKDFIAWAKDNPEALTVPHFATSIGINSGMMANWAKEDSSFREAYLTGKEFIGINRLNLTTNTKENLEKKLDKSIYMQTLGNYDLDVRDYQHDEKRFESSLKKEEQAQVSQEVQAKYDAILNQISKSQDSARKIEESNSNADAKS